MGWLSLLFIVVFLIWHRSWWHGGRQAHTMHELNDHSELLCKFIFEKLAEDIDACKNMRKDFKESKRFTQELKRYEKLVFNFLSMINKHKEIREYVYIMRSDKETLNIERDWYRYCVALSQLVGSGNKVMWPYSEPYKPYNDEKIDKIWLNSPIAIKEVEEKFNGILLRRELRRNGTLKDDLNDATNI